MTEIRKGSISFVKGKVKTKIFGQTPQCMNNYYVKMVSNYNNLCMPTDLLTTDVIISFTENLMLKVTALFKLLACMINN